MTSSTDRHHTHRSRRNQRGFTLIELLVVITLIVVLISVTVPSIARIIASVNYSAAVNAVTATLGNARSIAMQRGVHTAVAFLYDTETGVYTLQILEEAPRGTEGKLTNKSCQRENGEPCNAAAYIPAINTVPVELPVRTAVYGMSFLTEEVGDIIDDDTADWYAGDKYSDAVGNIANPWLFPRSDPRLFVDPGVDPDGDPWFDKDPVTGAQTLNINKIAVRQAMTFAIQFTPSGSVVDYFSNTAGSPPDAYIEFPDLPFDRSQNVLANEVPATLDDPARFDPAYDGWESVNGTTNPEVRLRTASQLAVVDLQQLTGATGVEEPWRLRSTTSLVGVGSVWPPFIDSAGEEITGAGLDVLLDKVNRWIDNNAEIIGFNRYTGNAIKR